MEYINLVNGVYMAKKIQREPKKCHINLSTRLPMLSESMVLSESLGEYITVVMDKCVDEAVPCLCGMPVHHVYIVKNKINGNLIQLGSECVNRINPVIIKEYKKDSVVSGNCHICEVKGQQKYCKNLEKHYNSIPHAKKLASFEKTRRDTLETFFKNILCSRRCIGCNRLCINKTLPDWRVRCIKCYSNYKK